MSFIPASISESYFSPQIHQAQYDKSQILLPLPHSVFLPRNCRILIWKLRFYEVHFAKNFKIKKQIQKKKKAKQPNNPPQTQQYKLFRLINRKWQSCLNHSSLWNFGKQGLSERKSQKHSALHRHVNLQQLFHFDSADIKAKPVTTWRYPRSTEQGWAGKNSTSVG